MRRVLVAFVRLLAVAAGISLFSYVAGRLVLAFQIRRASQLLEEVQSVSVGDGENSIRPLIERFGGHCWDVQLVSHEDYNYVFKINPWNLVTFSSDDSQGDVHAIERVLNPRFRRAIGLRQWMVDSEIAIKQHRVMAVQTSAIVEGRPMWLGAMWRLSEKPVEFERSAGSLDFPSENSLVTPGILNLESGTGTSWSLWTTPSSPKGQRQMANQLNFGCMRSLLGCDSVCDLLPQAARFLGEHLNLAPKGGGWDDSSRTCIKHDLRENHYGQ
jgi:hypothetical protein